MINLISHEIGHSVALTEASYGEHFKDIIRYVLDKKDVGLIFGQNRTSIHRRGIIFGVRNNACTSYYTINDDKVSGIVIAAKCFPHVDYINQLYELDLYKWKAIKEGPNCKIVNRLYGLNGQELKDEILSMITEGKIMEAHS